MELVGGKTGFIRARPSINWGEGGLVAPQIWTHFYRSCMPIFKIVFDNNVCNRKRRTYLKGCFKTSSKIRKYQTFSKLAVLHPLFTCNPLGVKRDISIGIGNFKLVVKWIAAQYNKVGHGPVFAAFAWLHSPLSRISCIERNLCIILLLTISND